MSRPCRALIVCVFGSRGVLPRAGMFCPVGVGRQAVLFSSRMGGQWFAGRWVRGRTESFCSAGIGDGESAIRIGEGGATTLVVRLSEGACVHETQSHPTALGDLIAFSRSLPHFSVQNISVLSGWLLRSPAPRSARAVKVLYTNGCTSACFGPSYGGRWIFTSVLPPVLKLALGLLLAIRPRLVLRLLARAEKTQGKRIIIGSFAILVLLLVVGRGISRYPWFDRQPGYEYHSSHTSPYSTAVMPRDTNTHTGIQWYALSGVPQQPSTEWRPYLTNAPFVEVTDSLKESPSN